MYNPHIYLAPSAPPPPPPPIHVPPPHTHAHAHAPPPQPPPHVMHAYVGVTGCHGGVPYPALPLVSTALAAPPPPPPPMPLIVDEPLRAVHEHEVIHGHEHLNAHPHPHPHEQPQQIPAIVDHEHRHPHDLAPQEPMMYAAPASPPRKRKRHTRTTTGCQSCRVQRVKCPEGPVIAHGKIACRRCWEVDRPCFYPVEGTVKRGKMKQERWIRAVEAGPEWNYDTDGGATDEGVGVYEWTMATAATAPGSTATSTYARTQSPPDSEGGGASAPAALPTLPAPAAPAMVSSSANALVPVTVNPTTQSTPVGVATWISNELLNQLLNPAPPSVLTSFSLANLSSSETDRSIVSYFESQGCNEICAATSSKSNWIFAQLFPRLLTILFSPPPPSEEGLALTVRQWLFNCLMHLCYVHRGNVETEQAKSWHWKSEAQSYRRKASYAILRAKVRFPEDAWKTEEYLMGFFVRCMADMLDGGRIYLDDDTLFEPPKEMPSPFYQSLWDMIATYSIHQFACSPLGSVPTSAPQFELLPDGPEWVETFFGYSRRIIKLVGKVNSMVSQRAALIGAGAELDRRGLELRTQAEKLLVDIGDMWAWDEGSQDMGKSNRIQRGSEVVRSALRVMLLTEVLNVPLDDPRIETVRARIIELVADAEPVAMGGFQWPLTVVAIYTRDEAQRAEMLRLVRLALTMSFGGNYRSSEEILTLCWEVLDNSKDGYENGIAPEPRTAPYPSLAKRKRHTRTTTGCRQCRAQRVKCIEGATLDSGQRVACRRCWQAESRCQYPVRGVATRGKLDCEDIWVDAVAAEVWQGQRVIKEREAVLRRWQGDDRGSVLEVHTEGVEASASSKGSSSSLSPSGGGGPSRAVARPAAAFSASQAAEHVASWLHTGQASQLLEHLLRPSPGVQFTTLSSLSTSSATRAAISYFETRGHNEIVAVSNSRSNWIFTQLFPRLSGLLLTPALEAKETAWLRDWLHLALLQLCYVHRSNVESDPERAGFWRSEAARARQKAEFVLLRARFRSREGINSEEYLTGFFIRCMADMLDSCPLDLSPERTLSNVASVASITKSSALMYPMLRCLIHTYAVVQYACTPLSRTCAVPAPSLPGYVSSEDGLVVKFYGFTRRVIGQMGRASQLVAKRWALINAGVDASVLGQVLRAETDTLGAELGDVSEQNFDAGVSERIQRGTIVLQLALRVMLLCEVLETDLADERITRLRAQAIELVADCDPTNLSGFLWPMTVLGIYCDDKADRETIAHLMHLSLGTSYGANYRGSDEVLVLCWDVLDAGGYPHGIAPWRESMAALGRNIWL
ncbi:uncharacterized protein LOC62_07G009484 [Vanrija pseudolonga]|uniref:Zn(2)-C6 fungal-type domain-containing protein n=1 Tax=Vanrija pseudolonga TaxID=143232 RepID=A0AAF0YKF8_9TREE|nr:hypothetical protein LOC62_07G009484 [Vanrija pseudolonga]